MSTVNLDLHFGSLEGTKSSRINAVQIYVKGTYGDGISLQCVNLRELDKEIARLQKELEALRDKGRRRFSDLSLRDGKHKTAKAGR